MEAKVIIEDRNYSSWKVVFPNDLPDINPLKSKLFNEDKITVDENGSVNLIHSPVRMATHPGIIVLK